MHREVRARAASERTHPLELGARDEARREELRRRLGANGLWWQHGGLKGWQLDGCGLRLGLGLGRRPAAGRRVVVERAVVVNEGEVGLVVVRVRQLRARDHARGPASEGGVVSEYE